MSDKYKELEAILIATNLTLVTAIIGTAIFTYGVPIIATMGIIGKAKALTVIGGGLFAGVQAVGIIGKKVL